jgi:Cu/Ag efflux protein CusF
MRERLFRLALPALLAAALLGCASPPARKTPPPAGPFVQILAEHGVIRGIPDAHTVVIEHDEIPGVMPAATTTFHVKGGHELEGLQAGDEISFQINVTRTNEWIGQLQKY